VFHQTTITIEAKTPANQYVDLNKICLLICGQELPRFFWGGQISNPEQLFE